jgi:catechol 2,3-dioxygenase-like lactoylglutathione lyase family enzyme
MPIKSKYAHTNLIAKDWKKLSLFYQNIFGCTPVPPERHYKGSDLEKGIGIPHAQLDGVHLHLPGYDENGPTLEIFNYNILHEKPATAVNRPGFGHIAFIVDDVAQARQDVLAAGGNAVGEIVTHQPSPQSKVTWCYVTDPEGNIIELQNWSKDI